MTSAGWALQRAVFALLKGNAGLVAALGGERIYDDVPRDAAFPYVTFGQTQVRDWSTGSETANEHLFSLHVWSREAGRREVHDILGHLVAALHDQALTLEGFRLVNLRHEFSETRREADGETFRGLARYRAVTEPLA